MQASPSSVRVMFFELCVHDGQASVRRAMLYGDSSCYYYYNVINVEQNIIIIINIIIG